MVGLGDVDVGFSVGEVRHIGRRHVQIPGWRSKGQDTSRHLAAAGFGDGAQGRLLLNEAASQSLADHLMIVGQGPFASYRRPLRLLKGIGYPGHCLRRGSPSEA